MSGGAVQWGRLSGSAAEKHLSKHVRVPFRWSRCCCRWALEGWRRCAATSPARRPAHPGGRREARSREMSRRWGRRRARTYTPHPLRISTREIYIRMDVEASSRTAPASGSEVDTDCSRRNHILMLFAWHFTAQRIRATQIGRRCVYMWRIYDGR